jgi:diaminopimelate decarboxylase
VPTPALFAREAAAALAALPGERRARRLATEPGRFLVARAGWLVAEVLHVRERAGLPRIVVIDAGMTELIRPALYGAHHRIVALGPTDGSPRTTRVDGPICESTDSFGDHDLPALRRGDLVAIADTGAYAASMASGYNGRPAVPQVLLETDGRLVLGRRRGRIG